MIAQYDRYGQNVCHPIAYKLEINFFGTDDVILFLYWFIIYSSIFFFNPSDL